jgi:hypothetical protein
MNHLQEVIEVEKTVSPKRLRGAPKDLPVKDWPVLRCRAAGRPENDSAWVAKPLENF